MASAPIYCTHQEFKRVFPQLDEFDGKTPIYGWVVGISDWYDSVLDIHFAHNTGYVDKLFWDGSEVDEITYNATETTKLAAALSASATSVDFDAGHGIEANDIIKINNEYIRVVSVSSNTITFSSPDTNRGLFNTNAQHHVDDSSVYKIIDASTDVGDATSSGADALSFVYDDDLDLCLAVVNSIDPNDYLVEAGQNFEDLVTQFRTDASRYLDSRLDPKLPKNMWKNEAGEFDYMIVRTTALYAAGFMVRTKDPTSEIAAALILEADNNVQLLNEGRAALGFQNTGDASKGIIRDITYTAGKLRPVDLKGRAGGVDYDRIKIQVIAGGNGFGTDTYSVWTKDSDQLKNNQVVTAEKITGDYQPLAHGLQVRFGGNDENDTAAANDEWEVEVRGYNEEVDTADLKGIKMTRRRYY